MKVGLLPAWNLFKFPLKAWASWKLLSKGLFGELENGAGFLSLSPEQRCCVPKSQNQVLCDLYSIMDLKCVNIGALWEWENMDSHHNQPNSWGLQ